MSDVRDIEVIREGTQQSFCILAIMNGAHLAQIRG